MNHYAVARIGSGVPALLIILVLSVIAGFLLGRDLNWDYFNYHDYLALISTKYRLGLDFFPAGFQGYQNPLPYLPFELMFQAGWHSALIGAAVAAIHSLNVFFLYLISVEIVRAHGIRGVALPAVATLLGSATFVLFSQLGSTFIDPMTTPLVMAAVWVVISKASTKALYFAGVLVGCAVGLKLTNVVYAIGFMAMVLFQRRNSVRVVAERVLIAGLMMGLGFFVSYGYWGWSLYAEFGNPFFPLLNAIFQSPEANVAGMSYQRFVPQTLSELVMKPFLMTTHASWIYTEIPAPDLRPLLIVIGTLGVIVAKVLSLRPVSVHSHKLTADGFVRVRGVSSFLVGSLVAWCVTSFNGRYGLPIFLLMGPILLVLMLQFFTLRFVRICLLLLTVLQIVHLAQVWSPRWHPAPWTREWLNAEIPTALKHNPYLYLSVGSPSESQLIRHVHPESAFVNPIGLISIGNSGAGMERLKRMMDKYQGALKVVFRNDAVDLSEVVTSKSFRKVSGGLDRFGVEPIAESCQRVRFNTESGQDSWFNRHLGPAKVRALVVCDARTIVPSKTMAEKRELVSTILDAFERKCPEVFAPRGAVTEGWGRTFARLYGKHDLIVAVNLEDGVIYYYLERQAVDTRIGHVATWARDLDNFECELPQKGVRGMDSLIVQ